MASYSVISKALLCRLDSTLQVAVTVNVGVAVLLLDITILLISVMTATNYSSSFGQSTLVLLQSVS